MSSACLCRHNPSFPHTYVYTLRFSLSRVQMVPEVGMSTFRKNEPVLASEKRTVKCSSRPLRARLTFDCKGILLVQSRVKHARRGESLGTLGYC